MTESRQNYIVDMEPVGRRIEVLSGTTLLEAARSAGIGLVSICGGEGWCESCLVRLVKGHLSPISATEETELDPQVIAQGYRLACQAEPRSNVTIEIPAASLSTPQRLQLEGRELDVPVESAVTTFDVECQPPSLHDLRDDVTRLLQALSEAGHPKAELGMGVLTDISPRLRHYRWKTRLALRGGMLAAILPSGSQVFGLAADIGTTKLAVYLMDLESGRTVEKTGRMNPQIAYGEDVMSRISYTREYSAGRRTLQAVLIDAFNEIISGMCERQRISPEQIIEGVFVGNTVMHHLLAGLPVEQLGLSPCVPALSQAIDLSAAAMGLKMAAEARIHLLPNIAGYVGADHVAMLLATGIWQKHGNIVGVDIGTNTEISLVSNGNILSCSAASGPAFEGAHIQNGMRAADGAIERVQIINGQVRVFTIENQPPIGICGSGILDAVAEMRSAGVINEKGALQTGHTLVRSGSGLPEFVLVRQENSGHGKDIALTRKDMNEILLAKSAIRVGIDILLEMAGVSANDIDDFVIAGAFGTYINVSSAVQIGMFPNLPLERFHQVGNAAGIGARSALISLSQRKLAGEIARRARYVELTSQPHFQEKFLKGMYL